MVAALRRASFNPRWPFFPRDGKTAKASGSRKYGRCIAINSTSSEYRSRHFENRESHNFGIGRNNDVHERRTFYLHKTLTLLSYRGAAGSEASASKRRTSCSSREGEVGFSRKALAFNASRSWESRGTISKPSSRTNPVTSSTGI